MTTTLLRATGKDKDSSNQIGGFNAPPHTPPPLVERLGRTPTPAPPPTNLPHIYLTAARADHPEIRAAARKAAAGFTNRLEPNESSSSDGSVAPSVAVPSAPASGSASPKARLWRGRICWAEARISARAVAADVLPQRRPGSSIHCRRRAFPSALSVRPLPELDAGNPTDDKDDGDSALRISSLPLVKPLR